MKNQIHSNSTKAVEGVVLTQDAAHTRGTILGQMDRTGKKIISLNGFSQDDRRNQHIAVFGNSGSGKTCSFVLPFCLQALRRRESLVITDPKGEVYEKTAEYFRSEGYNVRYLNIRNPALSDGWDLLAGADDNPERLSIIANVISHNLYGMEDSSLVSQARNLLEALLLRVILDNTVSAGEKGIVAVFRHLCHPDGEKHLDDIFNFKKASSENVQTACESYQNLKKLNPDMRKKVIEELGKRFKILQLGEIQETLSTPDIDLTLPGKQPCVYYCSFSDMDMAYNIILPLFLSLMIYDLTRYADSCSDRKCKVPVNFLLDEFAYIGAIPDFDKKFATMRSRGMNVSIVLSYIDQIKHHYRDGYMSLLAQCDTCLYFGSCDPETAKFFSERTKQGERVAFTLGDLMHLPMEECIIVLQGIGTIEACKYPYTAHPEFSRLKGMWKQSEQHMRQNNGNTLRSRHPP